MFLARPHPDLLPQEGTASTWLEWSDQPHCEFSHLYFQKCLKHFSLFAEERAEDGRSKNFISDLSADWQPNMDLENSP